MLCVSGAGAGSLCGTRGPASFFCEQPVNNFLEISLERWLRVWFDGGVTIAKLKISPCLDEAFRSRHTLLEAELRCGGLKT